MSESTKLIDRTVGGIIDLFSKPKSRVSRAKNFLSLIAIVFIVIPITFHFLGLQEKQLHANIISELSSTDVESLSPELHDNYNKLVDLCSEDKLWINKINSSILEYSEKLTKDAVYIYKTEISGWFKYVGFKYKPDVFSPVLWWNLIPLVLLSALMLIFLILEYNGENKGIKKLLFPLLWEMGLIAIVVLYSLVLAYIASWISPIILFNATLTVVLVVIISLAFTIYLLCKLFSPYV